MNYIKKNIDEYLNIQTTDVFVFEEAVQVIELEIDDKHKIELLKHTNAPITIIGKNLSDEIQTYILLNNFNIEDEEYLSQYYSEFGEKTQKEIIEISIRYVENVLQNEMVIDDALLSKLLTSNLSQNIKVKLFNACITRLNENTCKKHFAEMGLSALGGIFTTRNTTSRTYEINEYVTSIFEALKKHTWIYNYYATGENNDKYVVVKNPPRGKSPDILD